MKLSQTTRAHSWLNQFEVDDQAAARVLLDSIRFVKTGEVIAGVRGLTERYLKENSNSKPVAMAPILAVEDMLITNRTMKGEPQKYKFRQYLREDESVFMPSSTSFASSRPAPFTIDKKALGSKLIVFKSFDPAQRIDNQPGSEALVANLIREVSRGSYSPALVPAPLTLERLKESRVRTILCITDYIGSGQQVTDYLRVWRRHPTIRSWESFGWLKFVVVAYAATTIGMEHVRRSAGVEPRIVEVVRQITDLNQADEDGKLREVSRLYAKRGGLKRALGFKDSAGLYASSFSVPNNLPGILIERSDRWDPFFDERSVPAALAKEIGEHRPDPDIAARLREAGQSRLAERHRDSGSSKRWQRYIEALALLPCEKHQLAERMGLDLQITEKILEFLEHAKLIYAGRPTSAGRRLLKAHRKRPRRVSGSLEPGDPLYYPDYVR